MNLGDRLLTEDDGDKLLHILKVRWRLLERSGALAIECSELRKKLLLEKVNARDLAFIDEKRKCLKDLKPKVVEQYRRVTAGLTQKISNLKNEKIDFSKKNTAIKAYLKNTNL